MGAKPPPRMTKSCAAPSDIYVTVRVFQVAHFLVKSIRERKKHRATPSTVDPQDGYVDHAFRSVEQTLNRCLPYRGKHEASRKLRDDFGKVRKDYATKTLSKSKPHCCMDWTSVIDEQLCDWQDLPLSKVAADNQRFLEHKSELRLDKLSWEQLARMLLVVNDALQTINPGTSREDRLLCSGDELDPCFNEDPNFLANWVHLLLRLRNSLIQALIRKTNEILQSPDWHKLHKGPHWRKLRKTLNWHYRNTICWFSEYANGQHPLSTTWPWGSVKPSLIVLWGVCWMFYDHKAGTLDTARWNQDSDQYQSSATVAQQAVLDNLRAEGHLVWERADYAEFFGQGLVSSRARSPGAGGRRSSDVDALASQRQSQGQRPCQGQGQEPAFREGQFDAQCPIRDHPRNHKSKSRANSTTVPAVRSSGGQYNLNASSCACDHALPPDHSPSLISQQSWPDEPVFLATSGHDNHLDILSTFPSQDNAAFGARNLPSSQSRRPHRSHLDSALPPQPGFPRHPDSQVTWPSCGSRPYFTLTTPDGAAPPEVLYDDAFPSSEISTRPLIANSSPCSPTHPSYFHSSMGNSSYNNQHFDEPVMSVSHTPISNYNNTSNLSANSPASPVSITMEDPPRKSPTFNDQTNSRSHSSPRSHRSDSVDGGNNGEYLQGRKNYSHKRPEEPPRNNQNKMICKFAGTNKDCIKLTFDRKCEWSKHMDKHDRPYKCSARGCEKLRGFTYSGGLLRHEREVHKMHGGTKKSLFCPHTDCKRSSGTGFTRKENLAEHIRRVHRTSSGQIDASELPQNDSKIFPDREPENSPDGVIDTTWPDGSHGLQTEVDPQLEAHDADLRKRKRTSTDRIDGSELGEFEEVDLRAEVKRLRRENEEKDARLKKLEETVQILQQTRG